MARLMLIDDDANNLAAMRRVLHFEQDLTIEAFTSAAEALQRAREVEFSLVLADYRMPEMDGASFLEAFKAIQPDAYRIIVSAHDDREVLRDAINRAQIHQFIQKPWDGYLLAETVRRGLEQASLYQDLHRLRDELEAEKKRSEVLHALVQQVAAEHPDVLPADWKERL